MISKDAIIAHVILKNRMEFDNVITIIQISSPWDDCDNSQIDIDDDYEIIKIIPSLPGSYIVSGYLPDGDLTILGYEYQGSTHPNWVELLAEYY